MPPHSPQLSAFYLLSSLQGFTESGGDHASTFPPTLILILSRLVHDMERSTISYLVSYGDECFPPYEEGPVVATPMGEVIASAKGIAQVSPAAKRTYEQPLLLSQTT